MSDDKETNDERQDALISILFSKVDANDVLANQIAKEFISLYKRIDILERRIKILENLSCDKIGFEEDYS